MRTIGLGQGILEANFMDLSHFTVFNWHRTEEILSFVGCAVPLSLAAVTEIIMHSDLLSTRQPKAMWVLWGVSEGIAVVGRVMQG